MSWSKTGALLAGALLVAGCNTTDPTKGGFVGGVVGITSGNYDEYLAKRERARQEALRELEAEENAAAANEEERVRLEARRGRLRSEISSIRRETAALESEIADRRAAGAFSDAEADRLRARVAGIRSSIPASEADPEARARVDALEREVAALRAIIRGGG